MNNKEKILIVDDALFNREILMDMLQDEYEIIEAEDGLQAIDILKKRVSEISIVLLDIVMPNMDGFETLETMGKFHWIERVPVIMISAENTPEHIERAYALGAVDYINRPFDEYVVHKRVQNTIMLYAKQKKLVGMLAEQMYERQKGNDLMINILSHIVEFRNGESGLHVIHIRTLTSSILELLMKKTDKYNLQRADIAVISQASALHDIGKIGIPEQVLNKPGRFTDEEFAIMKRHSAIGAEMLEALPAYQDEPLVRASHDICRWHHERWDGRGYPDGLKGEEIPIGAQVVALADVYDALTSERVYKPAYSHEKAVEMILNGECGAFNPLLMEILRENHEILKAQVQSSSYEGSPKSDLRNMAEEMIDSKGLEDSENVLHRLEYERVKTKFFGSLSQEVMLDYDAKTKTLQLSAYGAKLFQVDEVELDPYSNPKLKECIESESIQELARQVRATSPQSPYLLYDGQLIIEGKVLEAHFTCMAHWNKDEREEYLGVAARIDLK